MKRKHSLIVVAVFLLCMDCHIDKTPLHFLEEEGIHIRTNYRYYFGRVREYQFRNVPDYKGLVKSFPREAVNAWIPDEMMRGLDIEYWVFTSIDNAEKFMAERHDLSSVALKNAIDHPLPDGNIGDNCWHEEAIGYIIFIRNNVWVSISPPGFGDPFDWETVVFIAGMIDHAILYAKRVSRKELVPAPIFESLDFLTPIPDDWGQTCKVKVNATDPSSKTIFFRHMCDGLAIVRTNGIFIIQPQPHVPMFVASDPQKFRVMIWAWNEDHLISLLEEEIHFNK